MLARLRAAGFQGLDDKKGQMVECLHCGNSFRASEGYHGSGGSLCEVCGSRD